MRVANQPARMSNHVESEEDTSNMTTSKTSARLRFNTILVDPPWRYGSDGQNGSASTQYATLTTDELCALPVGELGTDESVLLLWATWPLFPDALRVIEAWGYQYVSVLPWIKTVPDDLAKVRYGVGYWGRGVAEPLLVAKRKKWTMLIAPGMAHSRKPDSAYEYADSFPAPRLELFARRPQPGWYALGNELPGDGQDIRDSLRGHIDGSQPWTVGPEHPPLADAG
jgi:N6-adenosine-specific RNA methylase IME4